MTPTKPRYHRVVNPARAITYSVLVQTATDATRDLPNQFRKAFLRCAETHQDVARDVLGVVTPSGMHIRPGLNGNSPSWPEVAPLSLAFSSVARSIPGSFHCSISDHAWVPQPYQKAALLLVAALGGFGIIALPQRLLCYPDSDQHWGVAFELPDIDDLLAALELLDQPPPELRVWTNNQSETWTLIA